MHKGEGVCMDIGICKHMLPLISILHTYPVSSGTLSGRDERESASCSLSSGCVELASDVATSLDVMFV